MREWHGTQHHVIVREDGIVFQGKQYKSLSQIAYRITGTKWSGPQFFGLRAKPQERTRCNSLSPDLAAAPSTRASPPKRASSRTSTRLHAQREACEAFIKSQQGKGWRLIKTAYDDGGLSGGTMERPALQRLLDGYRRRPDRRRGRLQGRPA